MRKLDVIFISPGNSTGVYQDLSNSYTAIEPPTWALLLAQSCRAAGFEVGQIIDANAEKLSKEAVTKRVLDLNPRLICFVVYGQNVNAGTTSMAGALLLAEHIKKAGVETPISFVGSHVQSLPTHVLKNESSIDFVFTNEGVYALRNILALDAINPTDMSEIKGVAWRKEGTPIINRAEKIVPNSRMDEDLPGYAWDLLPYNENPLDLYRSPMWHAEYDEEKRSPYAAIQTSLGCMFKCSFCMINMINRNDEAPIGVAGNYNVMRHWSPEFIIKEFDKLYSMGVRTIKITDELFLLNKRYYVPLCNALKERGYGNDLRMWAYSRIDTVRNPETLSLLRDAGIRWLALGIESADKSVRLEVTKGKFEDVDIVKVVDQVHDADIQVMANYIFGLPGAGQESMRATLDLSKELCTLGWNGYAAMALPGSQLYKDAVDADITLPASYEGYSFHAYDTIPLRTKQLTAAEILKFRDEAFEEYHTHGPFLEKVRERYGSSAVESIQEMVKVKLKRKLLGD